MHATPLINGGCRPGHLARCGADTGEDARMEGSRLVLEGLGAWRHEGTVCRQVSPVNRNPLSWPKCRAAVVVLSLADVAVSGLSARASKWAPLGVDDRESPGPPQHGIIIEQCAIEETRYPIQEDQRRSGHRPCTTSVTTKTRRFTASTTPTLGADLLGSILCNKLDSVSSQPTSNPRFLSEPSVGTVKPPVADALLQLSNVDIIPVRP